jgi:hypothetical protein
MEKFKSIETLVGENTKLVEVELMLTPAELQKFAAYCLKHEIKFNDWIRLLAYNSLEKESSTAS